MELAFNPISAPSEATTHSFKALTDVTIMIKPRPLEWGYPITWGSMAMVYKHQHYWIIQ